MLYEINLNCFRKAEKDVLTFKEGLNVVKGASEAGKSTRIEALAFALFGSSALRTSLDEAVTWGHDPKELKVEVKFGDYIFQRSRQGAQVVLNNKPLVVGQKECSAFAANLLGADAQTANLLMFANQGGLRGVLNAGPKGTGELLESVADLDVFDRILEAAGERLTLGSAAALESRLSTLQQQKQTIVVVPEPDQKKHDTAVAEMTEQFDARDAEFAKVSAEFGGTNQTYLAEIDRRNAAERQIEDLLKLGARIEAQQKDVLGLRIPPHENTDYLELELDQALRFDARAKAYAVFRSIGLMDGQSRELFDLNTEANAAAMSTTRKNATDLDMKLAVLKSQLVTSSLCGYCGQDISQFPEAAAKNAQIAKDIEDTRIALELAKAQLEFHETTFKQMSEVASQDDRVAQLAAKISDYVSVSEATIPMIVEWVGGPVAESLPDVEEIKQRLTNAKANNVAAVQADAKRTAMLDLIAKMNKEYATLAADKIETMPDAEYQSLISRVETARTKLLALRTEMDNLSAQYKATIAAFEQAQLEYTRYIGVVGSLDTEIDLAKAQIEELTFNNGLVKKLRSARPVVTTKLWNMVLASVSALFSQVRGVKSVVERTPKGFTVNGQAVESLSGSTLDILGLAVRVALTKTFIPNCPFIVLDEPGSGCDADRVASLLGFLASVGYKQTFIITHDPISENFADNLIQL